MYLHQKRGTTNQTENRAMGPGKIQASKPGEGAMARVGNDKMVEPSGFKRSPGGGAAGCHPPLSKYFLKFHICDSLKNTGEKSVAFGSGDSSTP